MSSSLADSDMADLTTEVSQTSGFPTVRFSTPAATPNLRNLNTPLARRLYGPIVPTIVPERENKDDVKVNIKFGKRVKHQWFNVEAMDPYLRNTARLVNDQVLVDPEDGLPNCDEHHAIGNIPISEKIMDALQLLEECIKHVTHRPTVLAVFCYVLGQIEMQMRLRQKSFKALQSLKRRNENQVRTLRLLLTTAEDKLKKCNKKQRDAMQHDQGFGILPALYPHYFTTYNERKRKRTGKKY